MTRVSEHPSHDRIEIVDVVRGFALSGLFLVHMLEGYELYWSHPDFDWASKMVFLLFMGKSFSLLAVCFGFSCHMLIDGTRRKAERDALWFVWRLVILEFIGFIHATIYRGDIIQVLAAMGLPLVLATGIRRNKLLVGIAVLCLLQPPRWLELLAALHHGGPVAAAPDAGMAVYLHGDLARVLWTNISLGEISKWEFMARSGRIAQILGLYLIGLVLGRVQFFSRLAELQRARSVALAASAAVAVLLYVAHEAAGFLLANGAAAGILGSILAGWINLATAACWGLAVCALWQSPVRAMLRPLANVGRVTLTLYILQSLVFVLLFYPFGANLYAVSSGPVRLLVGLVGIALQIVIAHLWLGRFRYGPLEWAWRCATELRWNIPFKRDPRPAHADVDLNSARTPELELSPAAEPLRPAALSPSRPRSRR